MGISSYSRVNMKPYLPKTRTLFVPFRPPKQQHRIWHDGQLVHDNQQGDDKKLIMPVRLVVKSDYWWENQRVTDLNGDVWETDVFQYGDLYVILMTNGDKIQVMHDV